MAMLADPKRRQKLSSDPRNKSWVADQSNFGQQMMRKMGWTEGKGLGLNETGSTKNIAVTVKNNMKGLGCSNNVEDTWIHHQDDFNDLLSSLNQDHGGKNDKGPAAVAPAAVVPQSLQATAKKAKRRVHYNRFTKGKDLSTYSSSQMNCIMGVRSNASTPNDRSRNQSENNSDDAASEGEECSARVGLGFASATQQATPLVDHDFGVQTVTNSSCIQEYFAKKMKELQQKRNLGASTNGDANSKDSTEGSAKLDRLESERGTGETAEYQGTDAKTKKKKKSKKKKQRSADGEELLENTDKIGLDFDNEEIESKNTKIEDSVVEADAKRKKKKKKRRREEVEESPQDLDGIEKEGDDFRQSSDGDASDRKKRKMTKKGKKEKRKGKANQKTS